MRTLTAATRTDTKSPAAAATEQATTAARAPPATASVGVERKTALRTIPEASPDAAKNDVTSSPTMTAAVAVVGAPSGAAGCGVNAWAAQIASRQRGSQSAKARTATARTLWPGKPGAVGSKDERTSGRRLLPSIETDIGGWAHKARNPKERPDE
jgi:hypothetical protein